MNSIKSLATFFGWCTIINIGFLIFAGLVWVMIGEDVSQSAAPLLGITAEQVRVSFFNGVMVYRAGILLFNLVPYITLKIMDRGRAGANA